LLSFVLFCFVCFVLFCFVSFRFVLFLLLSLIIRRSLSPDTFLLDKVVVAMDKQGRVNGTEISLVAMKQNDGERW